MIWWLCVLFVCSSKVLIPTILLLRLTLCVQQRTLCFLVNPPRYVWQNWQKKIFVNVIC